MKRGRFLFILPLLLLFAVSAAAVPVADGVIEDSEYTHTLTDDATMIQLYWTHDGKTLFIAMISPGTGWVSVGFDPVNVMQGANYILAAVDDEALTIEDHFGTSRFGHSLDEQQDILSAFGIEEEGSTLVEFSIPLDSGDDWDKPLFADSTVTTLLAYHASSDRLTVRHTERSIVSITLDP